ncbi:MAG: hypothetical protein IPL31_02060 [Saprospiraceae bacterium]|nr:hypothetical protein [Saprospiraceae bacterium]
MEFVNKANNWSGNFRERLWVRSDAELDKVENPIKRFFIVSSLRLGFIVILFQTALVITEYSQGNYPIFSTARSGAICHDGWVSKSKGQGTCSHHGGVHHWTYPQIGFHSCNPSPYINRITYSFILMLAFSAINVSFRQLFIVYLVEGIHFFAIILYIVVFLFSMILYCIYSILKSLMQKNK